MAVITENERKVLLGAMEDLLEEYDYSYTAKALNKIIDVWATKKGTLIEAFKKHPNYVEGKFMIAYTIDIERIIDKAEIARFGSWLNDIMYLMRDGLPEEVDQRRRADGVSCLPWDMFNILNKLDDDEFATRVLSEHAAEVIDNACPNIRAKKGEKTSRVINRFCKYLGYDKHPDYNRQYAKYADALSPMIIKRHTVLSINPMDYLTMSFGNSWASCHTIDKENKRDMENSYEGMYSSGTMSYMLDGSSMVCYVVDASYDGNDYYTQDKINRQMFHWGQDKLVQGRLYPQSNDYNGTAYEPYRKMVQEIMSVIFDFPNLWKVKKGTAAANEYIITKGTHYADYVHFSDCTLSTIQGKENNECFEVGAIPICVECGYTHTTQGNINCCMGEYRRCEHCGNIIRDEDDERWVGDYCYCSDCTTWCEDCDEYHLNADCTEVRPDYYVCEDCLNEYWTRCDECDDWVRRSETTYIEGEGIDVCEDCLEDKFEQCVVCNDYYRRIDMHETEDGDYVCHDCYEETEESEAC